MKKLIPLLAVAVFTVVFGVSQAQAQFTEVEAGTVYAATTPWRATAGASVSAGTTFSSKLLTIKAIQLGQITTGTASITSGKCYQLFPNDGSSTPLWSYWATAATSVNQTVNIKVPPSGVKFTHNDTTAGIVPTLFLYTSKD